MNEALTVQIRNPFALREALLVAMEASWTDLSSDQVSVLKDFTLGIPQQTEPRAFHVLRSEQRCLMALAGYFGQTKICYHLKDNLRAALVDLMTRLPNGGPIS